jgi:hypothetical protein
MRVIVGTWLVVCGFWLATSSVGAQDSSLTLQVFVCPEGSTGVDPWAECGGRIATNFNYEVTAGHTKEENVVETSGTSGGSSVVSIDLTGALPGYVTVLFPFDSPSNGATEFACSLNGSAVDTVTAIDAVGYPAYTIEDPDAGDLSCTLFARGFTGDADYFGIAGNDAGELASETPATGNTTTGASVSVLPATGAGKSSRDLPIEVVAVFALLACAGVVVLRRRVVYQ